MPVRIAVLVIVVVWDRCHTLRCFYCCNALYLKYCLIIYRQSVAFDFVTESHVSITSCPLKHSTRAMWCGFAYSKQVRWANKLVPLPCPTNCSVSYGQEPFLG